MKYLIETIFSLYLEVNRKFIIWLIIKNAVYFYILYFLFTGKYK